MPAHLPLDFIEKFIIVAMGMLLLSFPSMGYSQQNGAVGDPGFFTNNLRVSSIDVRMSQIVAATDEQQLVTGGLGPCSAIAISNNGKFLLGHVSPVDKKEDLVATIRSFAGESESSPDIKVFVLPGSTMSTLTLMTIWGALADLNLLKKAIFFDPITNPLDTFGINSDGLIYLRDSRPPR